MRTVALLIPALILVGCPGSDQERPTPDPPSAGTPESVDPELAARETMLAEAELRKQRETEEAEAKTKREALRRRLKEIDFRVAPQAKPAEIPTRAHNTRSPSSRSCSPAPR